MAGRAAGRVAPAASLTAAPSRDPGWGIARKKEPEMPLKIVSRKHVAIGIAGLLLALLGAIVGGCNLRKGIVWERPDDKAAATDRAETSSLEFEERAIAFLAEHGRFHLEARNAAGELLPGAYVGVRLKLPAPAQTVTWISREPGALVILWTSL
jgi:hypothetical protein